MGTAKLQDHSLSSSNHGAMKHRLIEEAVNHVRDAQMRRFLTALVIRSLISEVDIENPGVKKIQLVL